MFVYKVLTASQYTYTKKNLEKIRGCVTFDPTSAVSI